MASPAAQLYQLQLVDQESARQRARLKAIDTQLNGDETVARAAQQLNTAQEALKPAQARARDLDLEIKTIAEKVKSTDADLYGGSIRSPKALQELQEEIESLKRHQGQLEDQLLEVMMQVEERQAQVGDAEHLLTDARANAASQQTDLLAEREHLQAAVAKADEKRQTMAAAIDPAALSAYEKLRPRYKGQVVAAMVDGGCKICGVEQTSMTAQKVRVGRTIVNCESCGRILADIS